jgi:hypothetical protein
VLQKVGDVMLWLFQKVWLPYLEFMFTKALPKALGFTIDALDLLFTAIGKVRDGFVWIRDKGGAALNKLWDVAEKPLGYLTDAFEAVWAPIKAMIDGVKWLIENLGKIPIPGGGSSAGVAGKGVNPNGDAHITGGYNLMGASPVMAPFAAAGAAHGLYVTSGLRPGAITANGTPSDHGIGKALDLAGPAAAMASFFKSLIGNRMVKQAFYDPLGSIFGGAWSSYREGGHSDHVHVATYDQGGILKPGLTLAYNGTGRNEYVSKHSNDGPYYLVLPDGKVLAELVRSENVKYARRQT